MILFHNIDLKFKRTLEFYLNGDYRVFPILVLDLAELDELNQFI